FVVVERLAENSQRKGRRDFQEYSAVARFGKWFRERKRDAEVVEQLYAARLPRTRDFLMIQPDEDQRERAGIVGGAMGAAGVDPELVRERLELMTGRRDLVRQGHAVVR